MKISRLAAVVILIPASLLANPPLIVAHRGASRDAPENTLPAFELAWKQKADAIEGDFHLSKDGHIICIHDADTRKVSDRRLVVRESTLAELRGLDVGGWKGLRYRGTTIPTIAEVFAIVPDGKLIFVEVKCGPSVVPKLIEEIKRSGLKREQIRVISFKAEVIRNFKRRAPEYRAFWLSSFDKGKDGGLNPSVSMVLETLKGTGADGFSSSEKLIGEDFIRRIRKAGYDYHVWTVNEPKVARRFAEWGALSITTDVPALIRRSLEKEPAPAAVNR